MSKTLFYSLVCFIGLSAKTFAQGPALALVIDDLGYRWSNDKRATHLPGPIAVSVLPNSPHAKRIANYAHKRGVAVMLHLPLKSLRQSPSIDAIGLDTTEVEFRSYFNQSLDSVPHVQGINNHQGSLITQHPGHMTWLMQEIGKDNALFFVDSYTTHHSVALRIAKEHKIPAMRRHVFLDDEKTAIAIQTQFNRLKRLARKQGVALAIAHPHAVTLDFLEKQLPKLEQQGFRLVDVATAIQISESISTTTVMTGVSSTHE